MLSACRALSKNSRAWNLFSDSDVSQQAYTRGNRRSSASNRHPRCLFLLPCGAIIDVKAAMPAAMSAKTAWIQGYLTGCFPRQRKWGLIPSDMTFLSGPKFALLEGYLKNCWIPISAEMPSVWTTLTHS